MKGFSSVWAKPNDGEEGRLRCKWREGLQGINGDGGDDKV